MGWAISSFLEAAELWNQVLEAEANRDVYQAKLDQVLAGASPQEIAVYEAAVEEAKIALQAAQIDLVNKKQDLTDAQAKADNDLNQDYEDSLDTVNVAYTTADQALLRAFDYIQEKYFYLVDDISINVRNKEEVAQLVLARAKTYIDKANNQQSQDNIDSALEELKSALKEIRTALTVIRAAMDEPLYKSTVSSTDRTSINTERANIDSAITDIITAQQAMDSQKISNQVDINGARAKVDTAQNAVNIAKGNLKSAQDKLVEIKAPAQQASLDLARAQLKQAQAVLSVAQQKLGKATLRSPSSGIISDIKKDIGETVTTQEKVISMLAQGLFHVEVDIPEVDVGKIKPQDSAEITLDAFPKNKFTGKGLRSVFGFRYYICHRS